MGTILNQSKQIMNKPSFLIQFKRGGSHICNTIYNHFLQIVLKIYTPGEANNLFYTTVEELREFLDRPNLCWKDIDDNLEELSRYQYKRTIRDKKDRLITNEVVNLISSFKTNHKEGTIQFEISKVILDHLNKLKNEDEESKLIFAQLHTKHIHKFKSKHTVLLYEYLADWSGSYNFQPTITELKDYFGAKNYTNSDFKRYIIDEAMKEIQEEKSLKVTHKWVKYRRKLSSVKFIFEKKQLLGISDFKSAFINLWITNRDNEPMEFFKRYIHLNNKNFLTELGAKENLTTTQANEVWGTLYTEYKGDTKLTYQRLNTDKKSFNDAAGSFILDGKLFKF